MKTKTRILVVTAIVIAGFLALQFTAAAPKGTVEVATARLADDKPLCSSQGAGYFCTHSVDTCLAESGTADFSFSCPSTEFCCRIKSACNDTDGRDPYKNGMCSDPFLTRFETCADSATINELYCSGNACKAAPTKCPPGYLCSAGACIREQRCSCVSNSEEVRTCGSAQFKICDGQCQPDANCNPPSALPQDNQAISDNLCQYNSCGECTSSKFCGWCKDSSSCVPGSRSGPISGSCPNWAWQTGGCDSVWHTPPEYRSQEAAATAAINEVFSPINQVDNALCIARCESRLDPAIYNNICCYGLFQISTIHENKLRNAGIITSWNDLADPNVNARAARLLYESSGWGPWDCARKCGLA